MAEAKKSVYLEFGDRQFDLKKVEEEAKKDYRKNNKAALKNMNLYVKPEDGKAYYTANDDSVSGSVDL